VGQLRFENADCLPKATSDEDWLGIQTVDDCAKLCPGYFVHATTGDQNCRCIADSCLKKKPNKKWGLHVYESSSVEVAPVSEGETSGILDPVSKPAEKRPDAVIKEGEMCAGFDMTTGTNADKCKRCEKGTVGTAYTGMSMGGAIKKTCEVANAVAVDWCPGSPIQKCRMGCRNDGKPLCKSTQFCAMRDEDACCGFDCLAAPETIDEPATDGSSDEAKAAEATPAPTFEAAFGSDDLTRFSTARNQKFELFVITESGSIGAKCSQQCNAMAECLGYYWFVTKSGREKCRGLSHLGNDAGTAETKAAAHASFKKSHFGIGPRGPGATVGSRCIQPEV
jgi:hypothetical protein